MCQIPSFWSYRSLRHVSGARQGRGPWKCKDQQEKSRRRRCMYSCAGVTHHRNDAHVFFTPKDKMTTGNSSRKTLGKGRLTVTNSCYKTRLYRSQALVCVSCTLFHPSGANFNFPDLQGGKHREAEGLTQGPAAT